MNGFIVINKPAGFTSHDIVNIVRGVLKTKQVGHTGTLDPNTTGVLAIAVGNATKVLNYLNESKKTYVCRVLIGTSTDTEDITGNILEEKVVNKIEVNDFELMVDKIKNLKKQIPPMYSSVKINGKKLYEYAREGKVIERKERDIEVHDFKILSEIEYIDNGKAYFDFEITGSKGIYIRTICTTIGELLGYPATMESLSRLSSGIFKIEDSITIEELREGKIKLLETIDALDYKKVEAKPWDVDKILNGAKVLDRYNVGYPLCFMIDGKFRAIYDISEDHMLKCVKGINA